MYRYLKGIRVTFSLVFFLGLTFLFLDISQAIPTKFFTAFTYLQFVPSVIKFFTVAGWISLGFVVILLVSFLAGRVYCSTICPLGIFQDLVSFFSRRFRKKKFRFKYAKPHSVVRYSILALVMIGVLAGSISLLYFFDPYSIYGRVASDFGKPVYMALNNFTASVFEKLHWYSMYAVDIKPVHWAGAVITILFLATVLWLSVTKGRLYCNTICPVGTLLGLVSRFSIFKLKIVKDTCTQCGKCAFVCKSQCINIKTQEIDFSRCVSCFNCMKSCSSSSVKYSFSVNKPKPAQVSADQDKRGFIVKSLVLTAMAMGATRVMQAAANVKVKLKPYKKKVIATPPGSVSVTHFADRCTACHLCVSTCPTGVLQPRFLESGVANLMQPFMDPSSNYCNFECTRCGEVCPTGAILPLTVEKKKVTQIGTVHFIIDNCVVYTNNTSCGSCAEHCPTKAVHMVPYKGYLTIPEIKPEICIGCGACEHACPVRPFRAIYVEGNAVHKIAKKPAVEKLENKQLEEFPF